MSNTKPLIPETVLTLLREAATENDVPKLLSKSLAAISQALAYDYAAILEQHKGSWRLLASFGRQRPVPDNLASDALDRGEFVQQAGWRVGPLSSHQPNILVAAFRSTAAAIDAAEHMLWSALGEALEIVSRRHQEQQQIARQSVLLN